MEIVEKMTTTFIYLIIYGYGFNLHILITCKWNVRMINCWYHLQDNNRNDNKIVYFAKHLIVVKFSYYVIYEYFESIWSWFTIHSLLFVLVKNENKNKWRMRSLDYHGCNCRNSRRVNSCYTMYFLVSFEVLVILRMSHKLHFFILL